MAHISGKKKSTNGRRVNRLYTDTLVKAERLERMADTISSGELSIAYRDLALVERTKLEFIPKFAATDKAASPELTKAEGELERLEQLRSNAATAVLASGYSALVTEQEDRVKTIRKALES